ncbi:MAG TPA: carboxypeptidase-like regulatory domain-containing protein, partial [Gemmatimonadales bacterium]|nr:carboxypeptidase-like regulatory domain-containing protein [Gemmatimonadales bacterium]
MRTRSLARPGLALLVALLALCSPLDAQRLGSIIGTVRSGEHGPGLEGARVLLIGTELVVITNSKGEFAFHGITPGKYVIQASAIGFGTLTSPIDVKPLETVEVRFEADAESFRLPDLEVAERPNLPADFVRRSQEGRGRYFSRAEIEKRSPQTVADLLR